MSGRPLFFSLWVAGLAYLTGATQDGSAAQCHDGTCPSTVGSSLLQSRIHNELDVNSFALDSEPGDYELEAQNKYCSNNRRGDTASSEEACKAVCTGDATCGLIVYYHGRPFQGKRCWIISSTQCSMRGTSYKPTKIWRKAAAATPAPALSTTTAAPLGLNSDIEVSAASAKRASKHFYEALRFWDGQGRRENQGYWKLGRSRCKPNCAKSQVNPNLRRVINVGHLQQTYNPGLFNFKWGRTWEYFNGGYCNELVYYFLAMSGFGSPQTAQGWAWLPTLWNCKNAGKQTTPGGRVEPYCGYSSRGRNWAVWGNDVTADPKPGDVVALACNGASPRASTKGTSHTTYFWMKDPADPNKYWTLGGNQPATNAKWYPKSCFSYIRRSSEMDAPNSQPTSLLGTETTEAEVEPNATALESEADEEAPDGSDGDTEGEEDEDVLDDEASEEAGETDTEGESLQEVDASKDDWRQPTYYGYSTEWRGEYWYNFDPAVDTLSFPAGVYRLELRRGATYRSQTPRQSDAFNMYRLVPKSLSGNHRADTVVYFVTLAPGKHLSTLRLVPADGGREKLGA